MAFGAIVALFFALAPSAWAADSTTTSVICVPNPVQINTTTTCVATVTDTSAHPTAPTGTVSWSDGGAGGSFVTSPCTLTAQNSSQSQCDVTYTPVEPGPLTITATYKPSSTTWAASSGSTTLNVGASGTVVSCSPNPVAVNSATTCTATVFGNSTNGAPTGNVSWSNGGGSGGFSINPCVLSPVTTSASQCSVSYTPSATGAQTITATYTPSAAPYMTSNGSTTLNVSGVSCQDPTDAYNQGYNAGFNAGFNTGFNVGFAVKTGSTARRASLRSSSLAPGRAQATPEQATYPACNQAFNQGFNGGYNPGFNSGFNAGYIASHR